MRIAQLMLTGFGRFQNRVLTLSPGMNIIYGPNESGKTTIQKFILGMLYGFKKPGQRRRFSDDTERYRPWTGGEYRGTLIYTLDGTGETFRVEREFDPQRDQVRIYDHRTGADVTAQFPQDRRKEILFAEEHLGLSEEAFRSTAWVGQLQASSMDAGRELVARVANLQESGREDLSVQEALDWLDRQAREIGTPRAVTRPYGRVLQAIEARRQEARQAATGQEQVRRWEAELAEARAQLSQLEDQLTALHGALTWARLREAQERLARAEAAGQKAQALKAEAERLSRWAAFPAQELPRLQKLQQRQQSAERRAVGLRGRVQSLEPEIQDLRRRLEQTQALGDTGAQVAREVAAALDRSGYERLALLQADARRLAESRAQVEADLARLQPLADAGVETLAQVEELDHQAGALQARLAGDHGDGAQAALASVEGRQRALNGRSGLWVALAVLLALGAVLAWWVGRSLPLAGALGIGALVFGALAMVAWGQGSRLKREEAAVRERLAQAAEASAQLRAQLEALQRRRQEALSQVGVSTAGEIRGQLLRLEQLAARRDALASRWEQVQGEMDRVAGDMARSREEARLHIAQVLGQDPGTDLEAAAAQFRMAYAQWQDDAQRLEALERDLKEAQGWLQEEEAAAQAAQGELRALLAQAGVESFAAFEAGCQGRERWLKASREAETLEGALRSLLGGGTARELQEQVSVLRQQAQGDEPQPLGTPPEYQEQLRHLEAQEAALRVQEGQLEARIETALRDLPDTADLERELQALEAAQTRYEEELAALELARATISQVGSEMHREFAPRLNRAMGDITADLTCGRYESVRIDESMTIRAIGANQRTLELSDLSGGTVDQFYLALRVALLDLVSQGQEPVPLMLDDPFVQYDDVRLQAAMAALWEISRHRQVILTTCHRREVKVAQTLAAASGHQAADMKYMELAGPVQEATL